MTTALNVLVLEDRESDARLMLQELRGAGYAPRARRVDTEAEFAEALDASVELVLADYSIPGWDTMQALALLKASGYDIPFILVSGSIREDEAVGAMREGADDYLIKDRMTRLGPAVQQALERRRLRAEQRALEAERAAERERAVQALALGRWRLDIATSAAGLGIWDLDVATGALVWDDRMYALYGMRAADFGGAYDAWRRGVHPDDAPHAEADFVEALAGRGDYHAEFRVVWPNGEVRHIEAHAAVQRDADGAATRAIGTNRDITERKTAAAVLRESESRFRQLAENIRGVFFLSDAETDRVLYVSPSYEQLWGGSCASLLAGASSWADALHPDDRDRVLAMPARAGFDHEYRIVRPDGTTRWVWARGVPIRDESGAVHRVAGLAEDVTERYEQRQRIARLSRVRAVLAGISSAILRLGDRHALLQEACRIATTEGVFKAAWALERAEAGPGFTLVAACDDPADPFDVAALQAAIPKDLLPTSRLAHGLERLVLNDLATDATMAPVRETLLRRGYRSGAAFPLRLAGEVVGALVLVGSEPNLFDHEEIALLDWLVADLSFALDHIDQARRLEHLAYHDALTGLPNARLFREQLGHLVDVARQESQQVCVVALDLEGFSAFNERFGRALGDELLREVGRRFETALREPYALARAGADTFMVASARNQHSIATGLVDRLFAALDRPLELDGNTVRVTARAGVALYPGDGPDGDKVFECAGVALRQARAGTVPHEYFSRELSERLAQRAALEQELRAAVDQQQFVLHYQPRVDLAGGMLVGAEALIRWQHPRDGLLAPDRFIPLAQETGLMAAIGAWVIASACAQQAAWRAAGIDIVPVAVNVSPVQFRSADLLREVRVALATHGLEPRDIDIELTESAMMEDVAQAMRTLASLHELGVGLALDDFGTGYSSLAQLRRFPFDAIKIDRSFVADVTQNAGDAAIATAIIAMAHKLGKRVVAEGVETEAQARFLQRQGCDELQGHFYAQALPADAFAAALRARRPLALPRHDAAGDRTVLVVDDEQGMRASLNRLLRRDGYRILTASSGPEALELLAVHPVQVIVSDQRLPGMSDAAFLDIVKHMYPETVRIVLSGYTDLETVTDAVNRGAVFKFLTKPWDDEQLRSQIRDAFDRHRPADAGVARECEVAA